MERLLEENRPVDCGAAAAPGARLCLDPSAVSESEARMGARELVSALAEEEAERIGVEYPPDPYRRATHSLGLVLTRRHALLQLAARARAAQALMMRFA